MSFADGVRLWAAKMLVDSVPWLVAGVALAVVFGVAAVMDWRERKAGRPW